MSLIPMIPRVRLGVVVALPIVVVVLSLTFIPPARFIRIIVTILRILIALRTIMLLMRVLAGVCPAMFILLFAAVTTLLIWSPLIVCALVIILLWAHAFSLRSIAVPRGAGVGRVRVCHDGVAVEGLRTKCGLSMIVGDLFAHFRHWQHRMPLTMHVAANLVGFPSPR